MLLVFFGFFCFFWQILAVRLISRAGKGGMFMRCLINNVLLARIAVTFSQNCITGSCQIEYP